MNLPQMTERMEELLGNKPASPSEAAAAAEEPVEPEAPEDGQPEGTPEAEVAPEAPEEETSEALVEDEGQDDIAWVKEHKGFDVSDPVVAKTLRHQDEMISRQGTEVGEARRLIEEERAAREAFQAEIEQRMSAGFEPDEEWEAWSQEAVSMGTAEALQAITQAGQHAGPAAAQYVLSQWHRVDPAAATAFQVEAQNFRPDDLEDPTEDASAWDQAVLRHPDMADYREAMTTLAAQAPEETRLQMEDLARTHPVAALENLYLQVKVGQTDKQRRDALAKANAAKAAAADESAAASSVATAGAARRSGETVPLTAAQRVQAAVRAELGLEVPED